MVANLRLIVLSCARQLAERADWLPDRGNWTIQLFPSRQPITARLCDYSSRLSISHVIHGRLSGRFVVIRLRTIPECTDGTWGGESERDLTLRQSHQQYSFSCLQLWWSTSDRRRELGVKRVLSEKEHRCRVSPSPSSVTVVVIFPRNPVASVSPSYLCPLPLLIPLNSFDIYLSLSLFSTSSHRAYCETV